MRFSKRNHSRKPSLETTFFHDRFYRYVRLMLRRYPKMRRETFGLSCDNGVRAIINTPLSHEEWLSQIAKAMDARENARAQTR